MVRTTRSRPPRAAARRHIAPDGVDPAWCRAVGAPLVEELRQRIAVEAAQLGATTVHQLRCFGRASAGEPRVWCEGRAFAPPTAPATCEASPPAARVAG